MGYELEQKDAADRTYHHDVPGRQSIVLAAVVVISAGHLRIERLPTSVPVTAAAVVAAAASQVPAEEQSTLSAESRKT